MNFKVSILIYCLSISAMTLSCRKTSEPNPGSPIIVPPIVVPIKDYRDSIVGRYYTHIRHEYFHNGPYDHTDTFQYVEIKKYREDSIKIYIDNLQAMSISKSYVLDYSDHYRTGYTGKFTKDSLNLILVERGVVLFRQFIYKGKKQ